MYLTRETGKQVPNYEHVKFAEQWIKAFPDAVSYGCPGLPASIPVSSTVGDNNERPAGWPDEVRSASLTRSPRLCVNESTPSSTTPPRTSRMLTSEVPNFLEHRPHTRQGGGQCRSR